MGRTGLADGMAAMTLHVNVEAIPHDLSEVGVKAAMVIINRLTQDGMTYTGGCTPFYSPKEWIARGGAYRHGAVLIICHDGGEVATYLGSDPNDELYSQLVGDLDAEGLWVESCTNWYSAVYEIDGLTTRYTEPADYDNREECTNCFGHRSAGSNSPFACSHCKGTGLEPTPPDDSPLAGDDDLGHDEGY